MDPISALGLSSNILTFIDAASKILAGTYEVYQSATGTTQENAHVDTVTEHLRDIAAKLDPNCVDKTAHGRALKDIAQKCETLAQDLLHLLLKLKITGKQSMWKSLTVTLKSMRKERVIAAMEKRLSEYQSLILLRLTMMLK